MRVQLIVYRTILMVGLAAMTVPAQAQQEQDQEAMMKAWEEATTPGDGHRVLDQLVGKWDATTKMWWQGPDGPATESKGNAELKWILDGRFLQQEWHGEMMGKPIHGMGFVGYDVFKKKYTQVWIDNNATATYSSEGTYNPVDKTLRMYGRMDEPMTGEHDKLVKYVTRIVDENTVVFEIFDLAVSDSYKVVEITYTRVQ
jgi:hypothetical protein